MARARFADLTGSFRLAVVFEDASGARKTLFERDFGKNVGLAEKDLPVSIRSCPTAAGWQLARGTTDELPSDGLLRVQVSGAFGGAADIGALSLRKRKK